jgi:hypothetical protein
MKNPLILSLLTLLVGCAQVKVHKVPTPTQYSFAGVNTWTAAMQEKADKMEGLRFYLPRPFVNVFESFPVATDLYLAKGRVSADNKFVVIDSVIPITTRGDFESGTPKEFSGTAVPKSLVFRRSASGPPANLPPTLATPRSSSDEGESALSRLADEAQRAAERAGASAADAKIAAAEAEGTKPSAGEAGAAKTGVSSRKVTNNNGAFAYTPLRGNFDIVYLPDFDEQYVVSSKANLGNANFELNLGQGWSLQGFNSLTDNSELNKRIFSLIDTASELAKSAATAGLGSIMPTAGLGALAETLATPRSGDEMQESAGTPVALKIVVVHYAAKGLYPVIKPRELAGQSVPGLVIDVAKRAEGGEVKLPSPSEVKAAVERLDVHQRRSTLPVYPYQYVSFNTFRYLAIQVLKPDGLPFDELYDKSGTKGDAGDRQAFDMADVMQKLLGALGAPTGSNADQKIQDTKLIAALKGCEASSLEEAKKTIAGILQIELEPGQRSAEKLVVKAKLSYSPETVAPSTEQKTAIQESIKRVLNSKEDLKKLLGGAMPQVELSLPVN